MKTLSISIYNPQAVNIALEIIADGGLVAFPTDTVYGLAASINKYQSINRLYEAKSRDVLKAIPILVGSYEQISSVSLEISPIARRLISQFWPGALTIIVKKKPGLPSNLSNTPTIGVRMPDHEFTISLLKATGALAVTSANLSGKDNPKTANDVYKDLGGKIELILDGGPTPGNVPSTVIDCSTDTVQILRQGLIPASQIQACL